MSVEKAGRVPAPYYSRGHQTASFQLAVTASPESVVALDGMHFERRATDLIVLAPRSGGLIVDIHPVPWALDGRSRGVLPSG